jgi:4-amino-4-deoxy-L-arabinose transferase-like glycosyltransferase
MCPASNDDDPKSISQGSQPASKPPPWKWEDWAVVLILTAIATAFNLTKAVHIDDTAYLEITRALRADPLHAMSAEVSWMRAREPIHAINQPHFFFYFLAIASTLFGENEVVFHFVEGTFTLLAVGLFHALARRFVPRHAPWLTTLFCLGPAFLPGQNVMCDVPMLAFWLLCLWALLRHSPPTTGDLVLAGVAAAAACLVKYTSLVLLPLLVVDCLWRRDMRRAWTVAIPLTVLAAWSLFNYLDYGGIHLIREAGPQDVSRRLLRGMSYLVCLGAVTPFTPLLLPGRNPRHLLVLGAAAAISAALMLDASLNTWQERPAWWGCLRAAFMANGVLLLGCTFVMLVGRLLAGGLGHQREEKRSQALLLAWAAGSVAFIVLFAPFLAVRHVLLLVPVALWTVEDGPISRTRLLSAVVPTLVLGATLAISDWQLADTYRSNATRLALRYGNTRRHDGKPATLWSVGHWGWQWYAEKAGMAQYDAASKGLATGDIVIVPENVARQEIAADEWRRLRQIDSVVVEGTPWTRLRTMTKLPFGGYYATNVRALPWTWSAEPLEEFKIYRVKSPPPEAP